MKKTVNFYDFQNAFEALGHGDQFTYEGLEALFCHLEQYEEDTREEIELDVIALCCDYTESTPAEIIRDNGLTLKDLNLEEEAEQEEIYAAVLEYLSLKTIAFETSIKETIVFFNY